MRGTQDDRPNGTHLDHCGRGACVACASFCDFCERPEIYVLWAYINQYGQVNTYKHRYDRDSFVSVVCILTLTSLFATVCLLPVDIALISSTTSNKTGLKEPWATPEAVGHILLQLKVLYYFLYSLNALMCLLVIPFAYFL